MTYLIRALANHASLSAVRRSTFASRSRGTVPLLNGNLCVRVLFMWMSSSNAHKSAIANFLVDCSIFVKSRTFKVFGIDFAESWDVDILIRDL